MIKAQVIEIEGNILNIFVFALVKCWQYKKKMLAILNFGM